MTTILFVIAVHMGTLQPLGPAQTFEARDIDHCIEMATEVSKLQIQAVRERGVPVAYLMACTQTGHET